MGTYKNEVVEDYHPPKFGEKINYADVVSEMGDRAARDAAYSGLCCTCAENFYCGDKGCGCYSCCEWKLSKEYHGR